MKTVEVEFLTYDYWNNEDIGPSIDEALKLAKKGFFNYCEIGGDNSVILMFTREELDEATKEQLKTLEVNSDNDDNDNDDSENNEGDIEGGVEEERGIDIIDIVHNGGEFIINGYKFIKDYSVL